MKEMIEEFKQAPHCSQPHSAESAPISDWPHLPYFDAPEFSSLKYDGKRQFKKDKFIDEDDVERTIEGEWIDGVPNGICIYENKYARGIITFTRGKNMVGLLGIKIKRTVKDIQFNI